MITEHELRRMATDKPTRDIRVEDHGGLAGRHLVVEWVSGSRYILGSYPWANDAADVARDVLAGKRPDLRPQAPELRETMRPSAQAHAERTAGHGWHNPEAVCCVTADHTYGPFGSHREAMAYGLNNLTGQWFHTKPYSDVISGR